MIDPKILAALQGSVPQNQNMLPGGYMHQAMQLSGVPKLQASPQGGPPQAPGGVGLGGPPQMPQGLPGGFQMTPQIMQYLQALMGQMGQGGMRF